MFIDLILSILKYFYLIVFIFIMKYEVIISLNCVFDYSKGWGRFEEWGKSKNVIV